MAIIGRDVGPIEHCSPEQSLSRVVPFDDFNFVPPDRRAGLVLLIFLASVSWALFLSIVFGVRSLIAG
jgi:hypothetical protein